MSLAFPPVQGTLARGPWPARLLLLLGRDTFVQVIGLLGQSGFTADKIAVLHLLETE